MPAKSRLRGRLLFSLFVIAAVAIALALSAPNAVGRLIGDLWVTAMAAVMGLIGGVLG